MKEQFKKLYAEYGEWILEEQKTGREPAPCWESFIYWLHIDEIEADERRRFSMHIKQST